jgi:CRP/FNR family transcriptional regulator, cyclic AMP receptor protein
MGVEVLQDGHVEPQALRFARHRCFARRALLLDGDGEAGTIFLLGHGQVRLFLLAEDGHDTALRILGPRQFLGIEHLRRPSRCQLFAEALTPVEAWALPVAPLLSQLPGDPALLGMVVDDLARQLVLTQGILRDVALLPVAERVHDIKTRLVACLRGAPPALNRGALAELIHARPETLSRARLRCDGAPDAAHRPGGWPARPAGPVTRRPFRAGLPVFGPGQLDGLVGHILSGRVQLSLTGGRGRQVVVDVLGAGDLVGLPALLGLPATGVQAVGLVDGWVELVCADQFPGGVADQPGGLLRLADRLGARLERLERQLARATSGGVRGRLLALLRELAHDAGPGRAREVPAGWSHAALADQLGASRESVTRALAALERAGLIRRHGRRILVPPDRTGVAQDGGMTPLAKMKQP